jgi:hypothetical protein
MPQDINTMGEPVSPWMMETGSFIIWGVLAAISIALAIRSKQMSLLALCLIGATTSFWQEFFGDWGAFLAWNPHFARLPFWGEMPFTTPVKPLFIPFSWGWWFAVSIPLLVLLVRWVNKKLPKVSTTLLAFVIAFPLFSLYQISVEGDSVSKGWWTYDVVLKPALESAKGRLPLIFPLVLGLWAAVFVALLARKDADGLWWHERLFGVQNKAAVFQRELWRTISFVVLFQVTFFIINTAPPIIWRVSTGVTSALVP